MKQFLIDWLLAEYLSKRDREIARMSEEIALLKRLTAAPVAEIPTPVRAAHMMKSFRVNRVPAKQLRAGLEWKNSPEYKAQQEEIRSRKAVQPKGEK